MTGVYSNNNILFKNDLYLLFFYFDENLTVLINNKYVSWMNIIKDGDT